MGVRGLWAAGCWLCAALASLWAQAEMAIVTADRVNVRAHPDRRAELMRKADGTPLQLSRGERVEALEERAGWKKISLPPDAIVWIKKEFVVDGVVVARNVNLRSGPSVSYAILGKRDLGDRVEALTQHADWLGIRAPAGTAAWVAAEYLQTIELQPPVAASRGPVSSDDSALQKVPGGEGQTPEVQPASPAYEGTVRPHGGLFQRPGTHSLWDEATTPPALLCYLDSHQHNLARYAGRRVRVWGEERLLQGWNKPLVEVARIELLD